MKHWQPEFTRRFRRHEDEMKWLYCELYGNDMGAFDYFSGMLYRSWSERPEELKEIDASGTARQVEPQRGTRDVFCLNEFPVGVGQTVARHPGSVHQLEDDDTQRGVGIQPHVAFVKHSRRVHPVIHRIASCFHDDDPPPDPVSRGVVVVFKEILGMDATCQDKDPAHCK